MNHKISRRAFLGGSSLLLLGALFEQELSALAALSNRDQATPEKPNILVVVFDTLAAPHMSLAGYHRATTPNLERFARRASVFHNHYAAANFTTPGTASILTASYPWTHRAFNHGGTMLPRFQQQNLFSAFAGSDYYRIAYSHNLLANSIINQCGDHVDLHLHPSAFTLAAGEVGDRVFSGDPDIAWRSFDELILQRGADPPASLLLSVPDRLRLFLQNRLAVAPYSETYPRGTPNLFKLTFVLEEVIDGVAGVLQRAPKPFLGYFHLLPPHEPYMPHRDFIDIFDDGRNPDPKPDPGLPGDMSQRELNRFRRQYDEFLAYSDHHFGRLLDYLESSGRLDDTIVVFTSDHGQLFERGIHGHVTPALYQGLVHVPLLISLPGQQQRHDVHAPTGCVDLIPTLLHLTGQSVPGWCEGTPLLSADGPLEHNRPVFAAEAKQNPKLAPLQEATVTIVQDDHKLIHYLGSEEQELYNLAADPEERNNIVDSNTTTARALQQELQTTLTTADEPYT